MIQDVQFEEQIHKWEGLTYEHAAQQFDIPFIEDKLRARSLFFVP